MKQLLRGGTMVMLVLPSLAVSTPVVAAAQAKADAAEKARAEAAARAEAEKARAETSARAEAEKARAEAATKAEQPQKEPKSEPKRRDDAEKPREDAKAKHEQQPAEKADAKRDETASAEKSKPQPAEPQPAEPQPAEPTPKSEPPTPAPVPPPAPQQWAVSNATMPKLISAFGRAGAPDPGPAPGQTMLVSFDTPNAFGVRDISSGTVITAAGSIGGVRAAPAGNTSVYRSLGGDSQSTFDFSGWTKGAPLASLSFEWGSIDSYNFVDFLNKKGDTVWTIAGSDLPQFNGDQAAPMTNQRLLVRFQREADIAAVRMRSNGAAFEFDSLAAAAETGAVPEPASWVMLIVGFGFIGHGLRRRRTHAVSA